jgi:predicted nuclease of predicted toxin-antitoxin system
MKILIDANLTPFWVDFLHSAGIESVHWWSVGKGDAPDTELLEWATEHDAAILTSDGDFSQLLAFGRSIRPSVIYLRTNEHNPVGPGTLVIAAYNLISEQAECGMIVTINDRGARMRRLPILSGD